MTLADELDAERKADSVNRCKVCLWFDNLNDADATAYHNWIANGGDMAKLYRASTRLTPPVPGAYSTFSRHVRECRR